MSQLGAHGRRQIMRKLIVILALLLAASVAMAEGVKFSTANYLYLYEDIALVKPTFELTDSVTAAFDKFSVTAATDLTFGFIDPVKFGFTLSSAINFFKNFPITLEYDVDLGEKPHQGTFTASIGVVY